MNPNYATAHQWLAEHLAAVKRNDEALAELRRAYARSALLGRVSPEVVAMTKDVYKKFGWKAYVQANLNAVQTPERRMPLFVIATFYARLSRKGEAIDWLEKAYEERDFRMTLLSDSREFDGLQSDQRFKDLVRRMGLPE